jgi:hypothetical protein
MRIVDDEDPVPLTERVEVRRGINAFACARASRSWWRRSRRLGVGATAVAVIAFATMPSTSGECACSHAESAPASAPVLGACGGSWFIVVQEGREIARW